MWVKRSSPKTRKGKKGKGGKMRNDIAKAVEAYKVATGKTKPEHKGWTEARRGNMMVNGVCHIYHKPIKASR